MKSFKEFITEAISLDTYNNAIGETDLWDYKNQYNEIFDGKYRKIIGRIEPNNISIEEHDLFRRLYFLLEKHRYKLDAEGYINGKVTDGKQEFKIGRILNKLYKKTNNKVYLDFLESFRDDPIRKANEKEHLVVVSKHPYDVLGSSTDRAWTSCVDLGQNIIYKRESERRINANNLAQSLREPYFVAYLVDPDDKNEAGKIAIKRPLARIMIYPFKGRGNESGEPIYNWSIGEIYGLNNDDFYNIVKEWVISINEKNDGANLYSQIGGIYYDPYNEDIVKSHYDVDELLENLKKETSRYDIAEIEIRGNYYILYDFILKSFIPFNHLDESDSPLLRDVKFIDDYLIPHIEYQFYETGLGHVLGENTDDIIHSLQPGGDLMLNPVYISNKFGVNMGETEEEYYNQYGKDYPIAVLFDYLEKIEANDLDYYGSQILIHIDGYILQFTKYVTDQLVEAGIDPIVENWNKLDKNILEDFTYEP